MHTLTQRCPLHGRAGGLLLCLALAACGGGTDSGTGGGAAVNDAFASTPTVPAAPSYQQRVGALFAGSYTMDCSAGGSSTSVRRAVLLAQDGVVRIGGLPDVNFGIAAATINVLASYLQHPTHNTTPPGVYVIAAAPGASSSLEFSIVNPTTLRLMKLRHSVGGSTTDCLTAPTIGGANPDNTTAARIETFANDVAYANRQALCTPSVGAPYAVDLTLGTKLNQVLFVPLDQTAPQTSAEDNFGYVTTDAEGALVKIDVQGSQSPTRALLWHNVACTFP